MKKIIFLLALTSCTFMNNSMDNNSSKLKRIWIFDMSNVGIWHAKVYPFILDFSGNNNTVNIPYFYEKVQNEHTYNIVDSKLSITDMFGGTITELNNAKLTLKVGNNFAHYASLSSFDINYNVDSFLKAVQNHEWALGKWNMIFTDEKDAYTLGYEVTVTNFRHKLFGNYFVIHYKKNILLNLMIGGIYRYFNYEVKQIYPDKIILRDPFNDKEIIMKKIK